MKHSSRVLSLCSGYVPGVASEFCLEQAWFSQLVTICSAWVTGTASGAPVDGRKHRGSLFHSCFRRCESGPGQEYIDDLLKALLAASPGNVATVADAVVEPDGMSIGGMLSASTDAVRLAAEESEAFTLPSHVGWLRKDDCLRSWLAPVCW